MNLQRLGFSTNAFKSDTLDDALQQIASIGYRGVEIMADVPHLWPAGTTDREAARLKRHLDDLGLTVSNVNAFTGFGFPDGDTFHPTWIETDSTLVHQRIDHTKRAIELTAMLGGTTISLEPGGPRQGRDIDDCFDQFAEGLHACLETARACGVTLGIEPEPAHLLDLMEHFLRLKRDYFAEEPLIKMNADLGHFFCVSEDPARIIRDHHPMICHVHVEDIDDERIHQHLVPGEGAVDFRSIADALEQVEYAGWVTVELYPYVSTAREVAQRAYDYFAGMKAGTR